MAIQDIPESFWPENTAIAQARNLSLGSFTIDAAGEKAAAVLQAPKAGQITKVLFRVGSFTSSGNADVRLETVSTANGDPSGTLVAANANATQAIAGTGWLTTTLTSGPTVAQGDDLAVVIANASGNYGIATTDPTAFGRQVPYGDHFTASWLKLPNIPLIGLEYSDGSYAWATGSHPAVYNTLGYASNTSPSEIGIAFTIAVPIRVCGWWMYADVDQPADLVLYDTDGTTALATRSLDPDMRSSTAQGSWSGRFSSAVTLLAGTYRLAVKPTTTTSGNLVVEFEVPSAAVMGAMPGGSNWIRTERTGAGGWSQTNTKRPMIGIMVNGASDGVGGGGGGPLIGGRLIR